MKFSGRGILLDIEGTTASVSFVHEVMFPLSRRELESGYLVRHWDASDVKHACQQIAQDAGYLSLDNWLSDQQDEYRRQKVVLDHVLILMDADAKTPGLKMLQGLIFRQAFYDNRIEAFIYPDVVPALHEWNQSGFDVRSYSSGSAETAPCFYSHTIYGDLSSFFNRYYDTQIGPKKEAESYRKIAHDFGLFPEAILFVSDIVEELDAARTAGLQTALSLRPGNKPVPAGHGHPEIRSLDQIRALRPCGDPIATC